MPLLQKHQSELVGGRLFESTGISNQWVYSVTAVVLILNLLMLLYYQHYLAGDFPFQDEWGYVNRLQELPDIGFFPYLFDKYQTYYMPVFLFVWYLFYALTHLDIMVIRYTGAVVSALVSLLLCVMLYRKASRLHPLTWVAILCGPFIVCSYNHWATYNQSIESVAEPLLFGLVLATSWAAEGTLRPRSADLWAVLCVVGGLLASGMYAPGLSLLPAIVGARFLLRPRIDWPLVVMAVPAVAVPIMYVTAGHGLGHGGELPAFTFGDVMNSLEVWVGLAGNALLTPSLDSLRNLTRLLGAGILITQGVAIIHVLRLPAERRAAFMVPVILTLYNTLVFAEILVTRFHFPNVAFMPRYSIHMIGGPVSLLFWVVTLSDSVRWGRWLKTGAVVFVLVGVGVGVVVGDAQTFRQLPDFRHALSGVRENLMALHGEPDANQQRQMFVSPHLLPLVYPGKLFLEEKGLAMYKGESEAEKAAVQFYENENLKIITFGPQNIKANVVFDVQPNGEAGLWIRMNQELAGKTYIVINGMQLKSGHRGNVVGAEIPKSLYNKPGIYPMYVLEVNGKQQIKSNQVNFVVYSLAEHGLAMYRGKKVARHSSENKNMTIDNGNLKIVTFGPQNIKANVVFNVQPNGEAGLWIRMNQELAGKTYIIINGMQLKSGHRGNVVGARVPSLLYSKSGTYPMYVLEVIGNQTMKSNQVNFVVH